MLKGEKVYLNNHGFNHLIRKRGLPRSFNERKRILFLIKVIPEILKNGKIISIKKFNKIKYWAIKHNNHIDLNGLLVYPSNYNKLMMFFWI